MKTITLFGDSILFGIIITDGKYAKNKDFDLRKVAKEYDLDLLNVSRMGRNSKEGISAIEEYLTVHPAPEYAVIEFGGNDADHEWAEIAKNPAPRTPKIPLENYIENLKEMARILENAGSKVSFMNLFPVISKPYFDWVTPTINAKENVLKFLGGTTETILKVHTTYNESVEKLAQSLQRPLINIRKEILGKDDITPFISIDGVHPSPLGHEIIIKEMRKFFKKIQKEN